MTTPRFSILIPTRDRPATFRHTLATVVAQNGDDYEIVVADNCSGPETRRIVEEADARNIRYTRSDEILPMAINWERGLQLCRGEYVTVLGDDDGFLPSTLDLARRAITASQCELISWHPHTYWWPDTIVFWTRNTLIVELAEDAMWLNSRPVLEDFYRGELGFGMLPMIYSAFFHRGIIEEAVRRYDGFFVPPDTAPDVASGILGLHLTERYIHSNRALTIRGNSGRSNGTAQWARSLGAKQREVYFREERVGLKGIIHEALVPSPNLTIVIASAKLKCREKYFPSDPALQIDLGRVLHEMIGMLNYEPEAYEDNLADIHALAAKLRIRLSPDDIPAKIEKRRVPGWGPHRTPEGAVPRIVVNCDIAGAHNIAEASRIADAMMPPVDQYLVA
jgi:glycosyltransferase involved in cell wall biosynthesis